MSTPRQEPERAAAFVLPTRRMSARQSAEPDAASQGWIAWANFRVFDLNLAIGDEASQGHGADRNGKRSARPEGAAVSLRQLQGSGESFAEFYSDTRRGRSVGHETITIDEPAGRKRRFWMNVLLWAFEGPTAKLTQPNDLPTCQQNSRCEKLWTLPFPPLTPLFRLCPTQWAPRFGGSDVLTPLI
jgi:hypothetical protein